MAFDFDPDLTVNNKVVQEEVVRPPKSQEKTSEKEASLVMNGSLNQDVVTVNNLLGLTQSHIEDDNECRKVISDLTEQLNESIQLMSIKEMLDYLKIKIREREFHVQCIFKAYDFIQRSEYAREAFVGNNRRERIIEASGRSQIAGLLSVLNR